MYTVYSTCIWYCLVKDASCILIVETFSTIYDTSVMMHNRSHFHIFLFQPKMIMQYFNLMYYKMMCFSLRVDTEGHTISPRSSNFKSWASQLVLSIKKKEKGNHICFHIVKSCRVCDWCIQTQDQRLLLIIITDFTIELIEFIEMSRVQMQNQW